MFVSSLNPITNLSYYIPTEPLSFIQLLNYYLAIDSVGLFLLGLMDEFRPVFRVAWKLLMSHISFSH